MDINEKWEDLFFPEFNAIERAEINAHIDLLEKLRSIFSHLVRQEITRPGIYSDQSAELNSLAVISAIERRLVEILDSIISSLRTRHITGASIQIRPAIEALAELAFLLQEPDEIAHRVRCYMMMELYDEIRTLKNTKAAVNDDSKDDDFISKLDARIQEQEEKLKVSFFDPLRSDFNTLTRSGNQQKWYTLATYYWTRTDEKGKVVSGRIGSVSRLIEKLNPAQRAVIKYVAFSLLSAPTHSANLLTQSIGMSENNIPKMLEIGKAKTVDYREFIRGTIAALMPLIGIIRPFRTNAQRRKLEEVLEDFSFQHDQLFRSDRTLLHDPFFQIKHIRAEKAKAQAEAERITAECDAAEVQILRDHADNKRKYPVGHKVLIQGQLCTLGDANGFIDNAYLGINYAVLLNGTQIYTMDERIVDQLTAN